ncbi:MAG: PQQ-binding-like beta-propeller repeat protein [Planctomycetaceae bacterium]
MKRFALSRNPQTACFVGFSFVCLMAGAISPAAAEDWAEFRGGDAQGLVADAKPPVRWSPEQNVAWKVTIPGQGWSSPIVYQGRIYLTTAVPKENGKPNDQSLRAMCLDPESGVTIWDVEVFTQSDESTEKIHNKNTHASPTPIARDDRIYVHFGTQGSACLSTDGEILWNTKELRYAPVHGNGSSPLIADNGMVVSCDGSNLQFVAALDIQDGSIKWKTDRLPSPTGSPQKFAFSTPKLIDVDGQEQIISAGANAVVAYDPRDGKAIWQVDYTGFSVVPCPVYSHGMVYICTGFAKPSLLAIRPTGEGNVTSTHVAWSTDRGVPHTPSLMVVGDEMYFISDSGIMTCVDAQTGKQHWQERIGGNYSGSPISADGRIYFPSEAGETVVVKASKTFEELARNALGERILSTFAPDGDALLIRTETQLYKIAE